MGARSCERESDGMALAAQTDLPVRLSICWSLRHRKPSTIRAIMTRRAFSLRVGHGAFRPCEAGAQLTRANSFLYPPMMCLTVPEILDPGFRLGLP